MLHSTALDEGLESLRTDRISGARVLATNAVKILRAVASELEAANPDVSTFWNGLRTAGFRLSRTARPSMGAAIESAVVRSLLLVKKQGEDVCANWWKVNGKGNIDLSGSGIFAAACSALDDCIEERERDASRLAFSFSAWLAQKHNSLNRTVRILTLSSSSSLALCLSCALQNSTNLAISLRVLESRPGFEGAHFAFRFLQSASISNSSSCLEAVQIAPDASVALLAEDVDVVLLGADRISSNGDVINKVGSFPAVLVAKAISPAVEVVVVSETDKIAGPGAMAEYEIEENEGEEVSQAWGEGGTFGLHVGEEAKRKVRVRNVYFEWVPQQYVDLYVTENGVLKRDDIAQFSKEIGEISKEMFEGIGERDE